MVVHTYTAAFRRLRQEFRASLDYIANSWAGRDGGENMREKNLKKNQREQRLIHLHLVIRAKLL